MFKKIAAGVAAAAVVTGGVLWATLGRDAEEVRVASASYGNILNELVLTGEVVSENVYSVAPEESGRVKSVKVKEGDRVTLGQEVAAMDSDESERQLKNAEAAVSRIKEAGIAEVSGGTGDVAAAAQRANVIALAQNGCVDVALVREMLSEPAVATGSFRGGLDTDEGCRKGEMQKSEQITA